MGIENASGHGRHSARISAADGARFHAEDRALASSLVSLAGLSTAAIDLRDMLTKVASFAVQAIPGADGAGLTLSEIDRADLIMKSEQFVRAIDEIQYGIVEGPCISAAATGETKRSGQLSNDPRWPQFGPRASKLVVHRALSLPLLVPAGILGAINVFAHAPDSFDERSQQLGETYAVSAALAVQHAQLLAQTARFVDQLHAGLHGRSFIDQAVGVLRRRDGDSAEDALARLRGVAGERAVGLAAAAMSVVEDAVRRCHPDGGPHSNSDSAVGDNYGQWGVASGVPKPSR